MVISVIDNKTEDLLRLGIKSGDRGAHTSRTMMFAELEQLLETCPSGTGRESFREAIIDDNVLGKSTYATRKLTFQRLSELYALDEGIPIFRYLRKVWSADPSGRRLLAFLCAYARDPLLRATEEAVLPASEGSSVGSAQIDEWLEKVIGPRLNDSIRNKVARNTASTWTQSGHLVGRTNKKRTHVKATFGPAAFALFLGYLEGRRATRLFDTKWTRLLEASQRGLEVLVSEASRRRMLHFISAGNIVEVSFPEVLSAEEEGLTS